MIGGQDEDSWGLTDRPRKAKSCTKINRDGTNEPDELLYPIRSSFDSIDFVMSQSLFI
ncbi:hypothetical protein [Priestia aryabhattai]|uniref:hypothetical protein n=1 Tax=Priestia aryabhattai TaxID=412384 RepID=UPI00187746AC|nr:hypothetical protein [Priestia aryabhattai]MBE5102586.1 hypothetical protein [Priestia aryabhattai]